jgi:hypothetical protein
MANNPAGSKLGAASGTLILSQDPGKNLGRGSTDQTIAKLPLTVLSLGLAIIDRSDAR